MKAYYDKEKLKIRNIFNGRVCLWHRSNKSIWIMEGSSETNIPKKKK